MAISKVIYKTSAQDTGTVWMDSTPATAAAADITAPKTAMLADGVLTTGTGSGGGGGTTHTATITGAGTEYLIYASYNDTKYYTAGDTFDFTAGDKVYLYNSGGSNNNSIRIDFGVAVENLNGGAVTYEYTLPDGDIEIELYRSAVTGRITVYTQNPDYAVGFVERTTMYSYENPSITYVGSYAFATMIYLKSVSLPVCSSVSAYAFMGCSQLSTVNMPLCNTICSYAFRSCTSLTTASFPSCAKISSYAFASCTGLVSLYLMGSSVVSLYGSNAFSSTPIGGYSTMAGGYGSIYVPASLITAYRSATNWTYFSSRFVSV